MSYISKAINYCKCYLSFNMGGYWVAYGEKDWPSHCDWIVPSKPQE